MSDCARARRAQRRGAGARELGAIAIESIPAIDVLAAFGGAWITVPDGHVYASSSWAAYRGVFVQEYDYANVSGGQTRSLLLVGTFSHGEAPAARSGAAALSSAALVSA